MIKLTSRRNFPVKREVMTLIFLGLGFLLISSCIQTESLIDEEGRELSDFVFLEYGMSSDEIVNIVGPPDSISGSGLFFYDYGLNDGMAIKLQFASPDSLLDVFIFNFDGSKSTLRIKLPIDLD